MGKSRKSGGKKYNRKTIRNKMSGAGLTGVDLNSIFGNLKTKPDRQKILLANIYLLSGGLLDVESLFEGHNLKKFEDVYNKLSKDDADKKGDKAVFSRLGWTNKDGLLKDEIKNMENLNPMGTEEAEPAAEPAAEPPAEPAAEPAAESVAEPEEPERGT